MDDLDRRLRELAGTSLDREAAGVRIDDDLATVRARAAERPTAPPGRERSWTRLAVAATLVLLVAGAVVAVASLNPSDETAVIDPAPTIPADEVVASVSDRSVRPGQTVTVTPAASVRSITCERLVRLLSPTGDVDYLGRNGWTLFDPDGPIEWCRGTSSDRPVTVVVPADLSAGEYVVCVSEVGTDGCAEITVVEDGRPPVPEDRSSGTADPAIMTRGGVVVITPASAVEIPCGDEYARVERWVDSRLAYVGTIWNGRVSGSDPLPDCGTTTSAAPRTVSIPAQLEDGTYRFCVSVPASPDGCALLTLAGDAPTSSARPTVDLATTTTIAGPTSAPETALPVGYYVRVPLIDEWPYFTVREVDAGGAPLGEATDAEIEQLLRREVSVGDGGTIRLLPPEEPYGRCDDREVATSGPTVEATPDANLIGPVRSLAATDGVVMDGVVVVGVDVCPGGTRWGDAGTTLELRRIDLTDGSSRVLVRRAPGDGVFYRDENVILAGGELVVESVSPDGAYVAVSEPYTTEDTRYHVLDAVTGGEPLTFSSACSDPRDLVGPPRFVGDGLVVLARECSPVDAETGSLIVELVELATGDPVWSVDVEHVAISSYTSTVSLSATDVEGRVWALVSGSAGVEQPIRAAAVTDGVELPLPDGAIVAFDPRDLLAPWDPTPPDG